MTIVLWMVCPNCGYEDDQDARDHEEGLALACPRCDVLMEVAG